MLIDALTFALEKSGCLDNFWGKLDAGSDATLAVAASARPFLAAARFAHRPQATLVVVAGEDEAALFARSVAAYLGDERVLRFPVRKDHPFAGGTGDAAVVAKRMEAAWSCSRALCGGGGPRRRRSFAPCRRLRRRCAGRLPWCRGTITGKSRTAPMDGLDALAHLLEERGYANTGELDGPGTFALRGGHGGRVPRQPALAPAH